LLSKLGSADRAKVYQADPLQCSRCGQRMSIVAFMTDSIVIRRIFEHLGLSPPRPSPRVILSGFSPSNCTEKTKRKPVCQVCQLRAP
jgi:hypothetical protein